MYSILKYRWSIFYTTKRRHSWSLLPSSCWFAWWCVFVCWKKMWKLRLYTLIIMNNNAHFSKHKVPEKKMSILKFIIPNFLRHVSCYLSVWVLSEYYRLIWKLSICRLRCLLNANFSTKTTLKFRSLGR